MNDAVYRVVFKIAEVLETPVIVLALLGLALVVVELGAFAVELRRRSQRRFTTLVDAADAARRQVDAGDREGAARTLATVATNTAMSQVLDRFAARAGTPGAEPYLAKLLADFDAGQQRRLGRTRLLVRMGPAFGLMGTLIPLSPALEGLAKGDVETLTVNLRVAFSVTVLGLLIGALAFGISLTRDRIYGTDYSDLEYVAAILTSPDSPPPLPTASATTTTSTTSAADVPSAEGTP